MRTTEGFRSVVKKPLESDVSGEILRYFGVRKKFENREYVVPVTEDFEFLNEAKRRFHGDRFESVPSLVLRSTERTTITARVLPNAARSRRVFRELYGDPASFPSGGKGARTGERGMKDTDHPSVHPSVHLFGERKF